MAEWLSIWTTGHIRTETKKKKKKIHQHVCGLAVAFRSLWFQRHIPGMQRSVLAFLHLMEALATFAARDKGLWVVRCISDEVRLRKREGNLH